MRSRSCAFWPRRDWRRLCEQAALAREDVLDLRLVAARLQGGGEGDLGGIVALGLQSLLAHHQLVELVGHHLQVGARHRLIETQQQIAGLHDVAVLDADLADDAAGGMLHLLDIGLDDDDAGGDDGAGDFRLRRPHADAADEEDDDGKADQHVVAHVG